MVGKSSLWVGLGAVVVLGCVGVLMTRGTEHPPQTANDGMRPTQRPDVAVEAMPLRYPIDLRLSDQAALVTTEGLRDGPARPEIAALADSTLSTDERLGGLLGSFAPEIQTSDELAVIREVSTRIGDDPVVRHEALQLLRLSKPHECIQVCFSILNSDDESELFRSYAAQHAFLLARQDHVYHRALLPVMQEAFRRDRHLMVRREALDVLLKTEDRQTADLTNDPNNASFDGCWDLLIDYRILTDQPLATNFVKQAITSHDPIAQIAGLRAASQWHMTSLLPEIESCLAVESARIRRAAHAAQSTLAQN